MEPLLKYRGGKRKEIDLFIKYIPKKFDNYIEPFFGGGALYFYLEPEKAIINDINEPLINFYREVANDYDSLMPQLYELKETYIENAREFELAKMNSPELHIVNKNEELYYRIRKMFNEPAQSKYSRGATYYFINKTSYSGMIRYNKKGEFNVPFGRYKNFNVDNITKAHSDLLSKATIMNTSYAEIIENASSDDFIFLDPPYDSRFNDYGNLKSSFGENEHIELAKLVKKSKAKILMIIGKTEFIRSLYEGYIVDEYSVKYAVNIRNRFDTDTVHLVIKNF